MAVGEHNPSRRALLGVAVGASFDTGLRQAQSLLRMSGELEAREATERSGIPDRVRNDGEGGAWLRALDAFGEALSAVRGIEAATAGCGYEEEEALLPAHGAACEAAERALGRLLLAPVPDLAGLTAKLEILFDHRLEPHSVEEEVLAAILLDARRLVLRRSASTSSACSG